MLTKFRHCQSKDKTQWLKDFTAKCLKPVNRKIYSDISERIFSECYSSKIWPRIYSSTKGYIFIVSKRCTPPYYYIFTPPCYYIFIPPYYYIFIAFEMVHTSILHFWLDSLGLGHHLSTFVDHGYDHLEICKQVDQTFSCLLTNVDCKKCHLDGGSTASIFHKSRG